MTEEPEFSKAYTATIKKYLVKGYSRKVPPEELSAVATSVSIDPGDGKALGQRLFGAYKPCARLELHIRST